MMNEPAPASRRKRRRKEMPMAKSYEQLQFTDDFMFEKVMEDNELCRDVMECLLQEPVGILQSVQTEQRFQLTSDGKPIRLDVYTRDEKAIYDAEMQNLNRKKISTLELPKRSRFYQSMMDADFLQDGTLSLYDGTYKIFCNCTAPTDNLPKAQKDLYDYICTGIANSPLTWKIEAAVEQIKCNEKWRSEYMKEMLIYADCVREGREEGIEVGREEARQDGIRAFIQDKLEDGVDAETILAKLQKFFSVTREEAEEYLASMRK